MRKIEKRHSLAIRWLHWINFPVLTVMIWSGLLIYWANDVEHVKVGPWVPIRFFGAGFYRHLHLPFRLAEGIAFHLTFVWFFALNGVIYAFYLTLSRSWGHLLPRKGAVRDAFFVFLHDLHLRKSAPESDGYNAAQRIAYSLIVFMGFGSIVTGVGIYKSAQFALLTRLLGGYRLARTMHFYLAMGFVAFFFVHVVQVIKAGWSNFRTMIVGYDLVTVPDPISDRHVPASLAAAGPAVAVSKEVGANGEQRVTVGH